MGRPLSVPSLWSDTAEPALPRPALAGDTTCDVAVVGGGYTGLWTAYYLLRADPSIRVLVIEAETVGHGASGRNGGWSSALFPLSLDRLATLPGSSRTAALELHRAMRASVEEIGDVVRREGIDAGWAKGGTVTLARTPVQQARARAEVDHARAWGRGPEELRLLSGDEARSMVDASGVVGGTYTPDCAVVHPARLVRGLAAAVEGLGGRIAEGTRARALRPQRVDTDHGTVHAEVVVRATEGYTSSLAGHRRAVAPVSSLVVATEPLSEGQWASIGLVRRPTFSEHRHLIVYGQRSTDGRLVFGGRGAPYHWGSAVRPSFDGDLSVWAGLRATVREMFPVLRDVRFTHAWGGPLGVPRDWCASVGLDPRTGIGWAGGYVGDGVTTSNLGGRTLTDLILDRDTGLTRLPWVQHRSPHWEPEPLRWLGINAGLKAMTWADHEEQLTGRPSVIARVMAPLLGH